MTTEGWIFMVGFRVFDVGLLIVWLVWFFRLRDDDDRGGEDGPGGGGGRGPSGGRGPGGGGEGRSLGTLQQGRWRARDHRGPRERTPRRGREALPQPSPARVRRPRTPQPAHRR